MTATLGPVSIAVGAAAIGLAVLTLASCSSIQHALQHEHEESFPTYAAAEKGWVGVDLPVWIPEDAIDLHNLATDDESVSVVRVTTDSEPVGCTDADRHGIPSLTAAWTSDDWPDQVLRCGAYEVMPIGDGWLGWFEAAQAGDTPS